MKKGFTLIEMLVAVFVFMILFLIAASFVNLAAGSTKSSRTKLLTNDIRSAFETINQKLNNANGKDDLIKMIDSKSSQTITIYGFNIVAREGSSDKNVLVMVSDNGSSKSFTQIWLDDSTDTIQIFKNARLNALADYPIVDSQPITSPNIKVTKLKFETYDSEMTDANKNTLDKAPYLKVTIEAQDTDAKYKDDNKIKLQTSYTMDYLTIQRLKNQ